MSRAPPARCPAHLSQMYPASRSRATVACPTKPSGRNSPATPPTWLASPTCLRTHRPPGRPRKENHAGRRANTTDAPPTQRQTSSQRAPGRAPAPRQAATPAVPWLMSPSAMRPWTPQHDGPRRYKATHARTKQNSPHSRESAASGPFSQVWQVLVVAGVVAGVGFEPTSAEPNSRNLSVGPFATFCDWCGAGA
jgi:hypothetical protein